MKSSDPTLGSLSESLRNTGFKRLAENFWRRVSRPTVIVLAVWLIYAWTQVGYDSPDEHFPTLEAAGYLLFGRGNLTWEFQQGLRSWLQPGILAGWIWPLQRLGIEDRMLLDSWARMGLVFLVFWSLRFYRRLSSTGSHPDSAALALCFAPWVIWGTRHGSDTFVLPFLIGATAQILKKTAHPQSTWSDGLWTGLWIAIAIQTRYLVGVPLAFLVLSCGLLRRRTWNSIWIFSLVAIFFTAVLEMLNAGIYSVLGQGVRFPIWEFFKFNVIQGSGQFHESPKFEATLYGLIFIVLSTGACLSSFKSWIRPKQGLQPIVIATVLTLLVLGLVRHQELRFVFCLLPWMALIATDSLSEASLTRWFRFQAVLLVLAWVVYSEPHGMLVRALNRVPAESQRLLLVGVGGSLPEFYLKSAVSLEWMEVDGWRKSCRDPGFWSESRHVVSAQACPQLPEAGEIDSEVIPQNLGYRLRQLFSETRAPQWFYSK
jgi:phosphatidylinositol glycan class B